MYFVTEYSICLIYNTPKTEILMWGTRLESITSTILTVVDFYSIANKTLKRDVIRSRWY